MEKRACFDVVVLQCDEWSRCNPLYPTVLHRCPHFVKKTPSYHVPCGGILPSTVRVLQTLRVYWSSKVWELEPLSKLKWYH